MKTLKTKLTGLIGLTLIAPIHSLLACRLAPALRRSNVNVLFAAALFAILSYGCKKEKDNEPAQNFDQYVSMMSKAEEQTVVHPPLEVGSPIDSLINNVNCKVQKYHWAPGYEAPLLLNPTTDVIFPGAMLGAESITKGSYALITGDRAPVTMSISLSNLAGNVSATAPKATLSHVREAIQSILDSQVNGATPAALAYEIQQVHSRKQLEVAIGANYGSWFTDISASFDFHSEQVMSRYIVKFYQVYYSIDIDIPDRPSLFWNTTPSASVLGSHTPVYVSSVKYGRMALCTFESTSSAQEIDAAIRASFDAFFASGEISISTEHERAITTSKKRIFMFGGSGAKASEVTGIASLQSFIKEGGNYSNNSPGAPLSYTLRFLSDNKIARIVLSSDYSVQTCTVLPPPGPEDKDVIINPSTMSKLYPQLIKNGADNEFGDHGANISAKASLEISADKKQLILYLNYLSDEPSDHHDQTKGEERPGWYPDKDSKGRIKWSKRVLYTAPSGWTIKTINSDKVSELEYLDTDRNVDYFRQADGAMSGGLVNEFQSHGYVSGPVCTDSGSAGSYLTVVFNPVKITIRK